jgi:hypothetical protein
VAVVAVVAGVAGVLAPRCAGLSPLLLVGGFSGGSLDYKHTNDTQWSRLWINFYDDVVQAKATMEKLTLEVDTKANTYKNQTGISIRPVGFGTVSGVDYLLWYSGSTPVKQSSYLADMISHFESKAGYKRDVNIRAATYDWRMGPSHMGEYYDQTRRLVEDMYLNEAASPVVIMGHCYGGTVMAEFLASMDPQWKAKYVKALVIIASPLLGAYAALESLVSGSDDGYELFSIPLIPLLPMRAAVRTMEAMLWMLPRQGFAPDDKPLAITPSRNYTLHDIDALLVDSGAVDTRLQRANIPQSAAPVRHPGVWVSCHIGTGTSTSQSLLYADGNLDSPAAHPDTVDGDGTVSTKSAIDCRRWGLERPDLRLDFYAHPGVGHLPLVKDPTLLNNMLNSVLLPSP